MCKRLKLKKVVKSGQKKQEITICHGPNSCATSRDVPGCRLTGEAKAILVSILWEGERERDDFR